MASFGATIRKIREQAKKSMKDLASTLGVSVVYISDIERGNRKPPLGEKLDKLADFLGIDRRDVAEWAAKERGWVEIELCGEKTPLEKVALALVRYGNNLTGEQADQILAVLK